jgi:hypothetical protein
VIRYYKKYYVPSIFTLILGIIILCIEPFRFGDFEVFLNAGKNIAEGKNIYLSNASGFKYFYSPLFATLLSFFYHVPDVVPILIWKILSLVFLFRMWILTEKLFINYTGFSQNQRMIYQAGVFTASFFLLFSCFHLVQMTVFLLWAILEGLYQVEHKKRIKLGAAILALAINIKIMPIVLVPWLIYRNHFNAVFYTILWSVLFLLTPGFFIGFSYNDFLMLQWFEALNPTKQIHILDLDETGFHSLTSFFAALLSQGHGTHWDLEAKRNIANLDPTTITWIIRGAQLLLIGFTLRILNTKPFNPVPGQLHFFREISYILLITPLVFPHQQVYGFLLAFPAIAYCIYMFMLEKRAGIGLNAAHVVFFLAVIIINLELFMGFARAWLWHYKTLTYGILLLVVALVLLNPKKLAQNSA